MEKENSNQIPKSYQSKGIKKSTGKQHFDAEADRVFDGLKRKYANAIAFLLVRNIPRLGLRAYFEESEDNKRRFDTIKKFRAAIIENRPKAKVWIDKPFYVKLSLGTGHIDEDGKVTVPIVLGECVFKQPTSVVGSTKELELYMETIARIIESEKVWADPDMADFDVGERDYLSDEKKRKQQAENGSDQLNLNSSQPL